MNQPWVYTCPPSWSPPTSLPIPQGCPSAPGLGALFHASNLDCWSISHMEIYMFQCYSLKSSHPHLLPQSPKVCSLYLCLFCCLAYRVIVTIFLNSYFFKIFKKIDINDPQTSFNPALPPSLCSFLHFSWWQYQSSNNLVPKPWHHAQSVSFLCGCLDFIS